MVASSLVPSCSAVLHYNDVAPYYFDYVSSPVPLAFAFILAVAVAVILSAYFPSILQAFPPSFIDDGLRQQADEAREEWEYRVSPDLASQLHAKLPIWVGT